MSRQLPEEQWFETLAAESDAAIDTTSRAPSRLKSKLYSAMVRTQQETGPLLGVTETKAAGRGLCVYEELVRISPVGQRAKSFNCCSVCHARVLGEKVENAPIYWGCCPYVGFQNR